MGCRNNATHSWTYGRWIYNYLRILCPPIAHYADGPFFRQCKIELNPQIHGLTRCIQQNVPSVRLILTDHGLDRMFWKGKGAFILGCTSPFKVIMIDRPGMGKVKNWRKSCAHCTKEPEKRSEGKKCKPGEAREREKWAVGVMGYRSNGLSE
jgi:hypothetical protein